MVYTCPDTANGTRFLRGERGGMPVARQAKQPNRCVRVGGDVVFPEQQFASVDCSKWSRRSFAHDFRVYAVTGALSGMLSESSHGIGADAGFRQHSSEL